MRTPASLVFRLPAAAPTDDSLVHRAKIWKRPPSSLMLLRRKTVALSARVSRIWVAVLRRGSQHRRVQQKERRREETKKKATARMFQQRGIF